jgi:Polysaccharide pyruvyl transferase
VSLFPVGHFIHVDLFDDVLARQGRPERFEDVAIITPAPVFGRMSARKRPPTIGIILRGLQAEYGPEHCLWERTEHIALEAANSLVEKHGGRMVMIENHLTRSGLTPHGIEALYAECDLIITSRFHGAMLALRKLVPFLAIDQIRGGAKVLDLVGATGWPFFSTAGNPDAVRLAADASELLTAKFERLLFHVRTRTIDRTNGTLARLDELVRAMPSADRMDNPPPGERPRTDTRSEAR